MVTSEGYASGKYFGSQYCQVKAFWDENNTEIHDWGCMPESRLRLVDWG
ncbi:hypothetical protein [Thermococcus kodakarensis]|nr:hypothetical protein [Thermococcus kodakarensis]WCN28015.1 hypothetical protein POG15_11095 [Thermococcus kodakarensis]